MVTVLTPTALVGPYPTLPPTALSLDVPMVAADTAGNSFKSTGHETLFWRNSGVGTHHITITSVADSLKRTGTITAYAIGAGLYGGFDFIGDMTGWKDGSGNITFTCDDAEVLVGIQRHPG
jgi:hypothetical protein